MPSTPERTRQWLGLSALAMSLTAVGCAEDEGERTIPVGRYHYVASHPQPGQEGSIHLEGVMVISVAQRDSIAGHWEVPELQQKMELGAWQGDAYQVMAHPTYFGVLSHRIRRGPAPGELQCEGEYSWTAQGGVEEAVPVTCSLSPEEITRPEMPDRGAQDPVVRPIDADSAPPAGVRPQGAAGTGVDTAGAAR